jgi:NTE family protein
MARGKIGLALSGGAARGWGHIGVVKALTAAGLKPDVVAGTSIGAVIGACYAAGRLDAVEEFALSLTRRRMFSYLDFNLAGTGLINGQKLNERLARELGSARIESFPVRFAAVATEIGTGHEVWLTSGPAAEAVCASYALPGIFRPVKVAGRWLFDGALVNPVPVSVCRALGASFVIAVNCNFDVLSRGTVLQQFEPALPVRPSAEPQDHPGQRNGVTVRRLLQRQMYGRKNDDVPGISTVMMDAFNIVQDRIARSRLAGDPPDTMISIRLADIGLFDFHRAAETIARGEAATQRVLDEIAKEIGGLAVCAEAGAVQP